MADWRVRLTVLVCCCGIGVWVWWRLTPKYVSPVDTQALPGVISGQPDVCHQIRVCLVSLKKPVSPLMKCDSATVRSHLKQLLCFINLVFWSSYTVYAVQVNFLFALLNEPQDGKISSSSTLCILNLTLSCTASEACQFHHVWVIGISHNTIQDGFSCHPPHSPLLAISPPPGLLHLKIILQWVLIKAVTEQK